MKNFTTFIKLSALICFSFLPFACAGEQNRTAAVNDAKNETKNKAASSTPGAPSIGVSAPDADAAEPAIAAAPDGSGVYLVWVEHGASRAADVYLQKFDNEAKAAGEKVRVNPQAGQATAWRGDPPTITIAASGEIYVGWTARVKTETASGTDLYVSVSRDGGKSFDAPAKVNDDSAPASHGMHSLAADGGGKIHVAWLDERNIKMPAHAANRAAEISNGFRFVKAHHTPTPEAKPMPTPQPQPEKAEETEPNSEIFYAVSKDGAKTFSPNKKISSEVCPCCKTSLLAAGDGKVYASWRQVLPGDFRHIAVASTADGGESFSKPAIVSDDRWQIAACPVSGAALAISPETGALRAAWFTAGAAGKPGIYTAESADGGKSFSARTLINEGAASGTPIFLARGESVIWEAGGKLLRAGIKANQAGQAAEITDGAMPAAVAVSNGKTFIAFSRKEGERRAVRLSVLDAF
ncbi:MAG: glycoside hydrolase [Acidobacteriota bacterium]|nr:glycoside hydrolase [Acidobacteriota bacterium]